VANDSVLVVGGGIAGLALARALRRVHVPVILAERSPGAVGGGLAINLPGNAVTAIAALGLGDELAELGRPTRRREYRSDRGRLLFSVDEVAFWGAAAQPRCVRRSDLLSLLTRGLDVALRPSAVESLRLIPDGAEVDFSGGSRERHGFVVGADGVRSVVRRSAFGAGGLREALMSAASWRFMAPNPGVDCWSVWAGEGGVFLMIPVDDGQVYGYVAATRAATVGADSSWLWSSFGGYPSPVREVLESLQRDSSMLYHSPVEEVRLPSWSAGRCVLIGDAAHATAPVWAQGAALAVEDALTLADQLIGGDWDSVGVRYEKRRRSRVAGVQAATDRFSRASAAPTWLRNFLLPVVGPLAYKGAYGSLREPVAVG
jgi:2-polyprenyl-6-methoxyphenol hydroxylase-like FAD-dependent oxidoreductase